MAENLFWLESERALLFYGSHVRTKGLALVLISSPTNPVILSCRVTPSYPGTSPSPLATDLGPSHSPPRRRRQFAYEYCHHFMSRDALSRSEIPVCSSYRSCELPIPLHAESASSCSSNVNTSSLPRSADRMMLPSSSRQGSPSLLFLSPLLNSGW